MRDTPPPTYYPDEIGEKCDAKEVSQSQLNYEIVNVGDKAHGTYTYTHTCPSVPSAQVPNSPPRTVRRKRPQLDPRQLGSWIPVKLATKRRLHDGGADRNRQEL